MHESAPRPAVAVLTPLGPGEYRLSGALTFETVTELWAAGGPQAGPDRPCRVDLGGVRQVDSAGLALLVEWARTRPVAYRDPPPGLASLARVGGLGHLFGLE